LKGNGDLKKLLWDFMQRFETESNDPKSAQFAQGLFGYFTFDAVQFFETIRFRNGSDAVNQVPMARYRLYQYVIAINHYKDELLLLENKIAGLQSEIELVTSLINSKDVPVYPFKTTSEETSNMSDEDYVETVKKGIGSCYRGNVFQIVLSRRFQQSFVGDEFNVYRALRNINPSPYLFFFDYGDYKLIGSSPEAQLIIRNGKAVVHPIAGTFKRTGDDVIDQQKADELVKDPKENAEHVMLVDLARNDLSTVCSNVKVNHYKQVQYYSHVIHLVSEVTGNVAEGANPFEILFKTFPAGTLSGAPKYKAMQLIDEYEPTPRSFYGGAIGFVGFNGSCNHAIMIRTLLSKSNTLILQAGAGVVAASKPESELQEVNNKLNALKSAIEMASTIL
jgi:anthranilate synthase component 1